MKTIVIRFAMTLLRIVNILFKPVKIKDRVLITSRQSDKPSLDIEMLENRLRKEGVEVVVLCGTLKNSLKGIMAFAVYTLKQMKLIAGSKVVVIDGYCMCASVLPKKEGQTIIQMWHALGAIKKFGWQSVENPDGRTPEVAKAMKMHRNYDYFLAPSELTAGFFAEGFNTDARKAVKIGLPRIDFIRAEDKVKRQEILAAYPSVEKKINILYVPTFRKNAAVEIEELIKIIDFEKFNFIIKKHFLDKGDYSWAKAAGAIVDEKFSSMEWLRICDKAVTDYSAIALESVIADKELYIYQPDVNRYEQNTGLNIDMAKEPIAGYVSYSAEEFAEKISQEYDMEKARAFRDRYLEIDFNDCTGQLTRFIRNLL